MSVDAVVVTYNRKNKLKECIYSLLKFKLNNIFIIDNASSDGTDVFLNHLCKTQPKLRVYRLEKNLGGAGGFNYGMKKFIEESQSDYVWVMDDDTIPNEESLDLLVSSIEKVSPNRRGFAIGQIYWTDGNLAEMNIPIISKKGRLDEKNVYIDQASFVAILFSRTCITKIGYPISDFFIWGDDVEYTNRAVQEGFLGVQNLSAKIIHKMNANKGINILNENTDINRIERYFYNYRNRMYLSKKNGFIPFLRTICGRFVWILRVLLKKNKFKVLKIKIILKGTMVGLRFNPTIEYIK